MVEAYLESTEIELQENPRKEPPVDENGVIKVYRRPDGMIVIPMQDGSTRVVTEQQYQVLFERQQKKRNLLKQKLKASAKDLASAQTESDSV